MERKVASLILYGFVVFASCLLGLGCDTKSLLSTIEEDVRSATAPTSYTLTIEAEPAIGGTASPIGTVTVRKDSPITIQATADVCADWIGWTVKSGTGVGFGDVSRESTTVTLTQSDATIVADFHLVYFDLTTSGIHGSVTPSGTIAVLRSKGTVISCTPNTNYYFSSWTANPPGNATFDNPALASTTVSLTGDAVVTANCTNVLWNLTVNHSGFGSTTPTGTVAVPQGSPQSIVATPDGGYSFAGWAVVSGSGVSIAEPANANTTVTLSGEDGTISAAFVVTPVIQSASPVSGSTISVSQVITLGFNKTMNPGSLTVDGTLVSPGFTTSWPNTATLSISPQSAWTEGSKTLSVTCKDMDGVEVVGNLTYTVDATAPSISLINYGNNSAITKSTSLAITFSEAIVQSNPAPSFGGTLLVSGFGLVWSNGNRTVTLSPPSTSWPVGSWKTLTINCSDPYQNSFSTTLQYGILDAFVYVKTSADGGSDANPGTQTHPKATIQAAINLADALYTDAEVHVAEGTFDVTSGTTYVVLKEGIDLYGGYDKANWTLRGKTTTIRDLNTTGGYQTKPNCAVYAASGLTTATKIDGFTIRGGSGVDTAGIFCDGSSPTISNNIVYGGLDCTGRAVGVYGYHNASPYIGPGNTIIGGTSSANYQDQSPRGIYVWDNCAPTIVGNTISGGGGGSTKYTAGIDVWTSTAVIARNAISGGTASSNSTGIDYRYGYASVGSIRNNTVFGGTSVDTYGIMMFDSMPDVRNNTVDGGSASSTSYAIQINSGTAYHPNVENNQVFTKSGTSRRGIQVYHTCTPNRLNNNNIFGCTSLYIGDGTNCTTITAVNNLSFADGNISEDISAYLDAAYRFTGNLGSYTFDTVGLDGVAPAQNWGFTDDKDGGTRSGNGSTGWSIGAYEY